MALEENTTINGVQLEHVIIEKEMKKNSYASAYLNFSSDHKSIAFRIASCANSFTATFKQSISFNQDYHTRKKAKTHWNEKIASIMPEQASEAQGWTETTSEKENNQRKENMKHLKILLFNNPARTNLCFSNSITSAVLNIPVLKCILSTKTEQMKLHESENEIINELINLNNLSSFCQATTLKLRSIVQENCMDSGQITRSFGDNLQHDAGEFLISILEHLFKDWTAVNNLNEQIFGGLFRETLFCECGNVKELPVQKLSEVLMIPLKGPSIQRCLNDFLNDEKIEHKCFLCKKQTCKKKIDIIIDPSTLIIQLKRYDYDTEKGKATKKQDEVECSKTLKLASGSTYTISSIINHKGENPEKGHYNVLIFNQANNSFVLLDDLNVTYDVQTTSDMNRISYIFVYTKDV